VSGIFAAHINGALDENTHAIGTPIIPTNAIFLWLDRVVFGWKFPVREERRRKPHIGRVCLPNFRGLGLESDADCRRG
jgi:hypothetical protein